MVNMFAFEQMNTTKRILNVIICLFPSAIPVGATQFDHWARSIFYAFGLNDTPNARHSLASLIMHLGPVTAFKSKFYFYLSVKKSMANETAFETIQSLKKEEAAYIAKHMAEAAKAQAPQDETIAVAPV